MSLRKGKIILGLLFGILYIFFGGVQNIYALTVLESDLNNNGVVDSTEAEVILTSNKSLFHGEYNFNNLIISNNATLTLDGAPLSTDSFKGVKINATNMTVFAGARVSAEGKGHDWTGPGAGIGSMVAASYGGAGGGNTATSTYGSATKPIDLGTGASGYRGGGAIWLVVTGALLNNGTISANANSQRSSGGSIYVTTHNLEGTGTFSANGGDTSWPSYVAGGGGRIAMHYQQSSFTGTAKANAGVYCFYGCNPAGGSGTVAFFDTTNNDLHIKSSFRFQTNDSPFNFRNIYLSNGGNADTENGISITADNISLQTAPQFTINDKVVVKSNTLFLTQNSLMSLMGAPVLDIYSITIGQGSTLVLSGDELLTANTVNIQNGGTITVAKEHILSLTVPNLNISSGSSISANFKGYGSGFGQGVPATPTAGASYGGVGLWNTATSTYGSSTAPVDFGSGGNGHQSYSQGGGAIKIVSDSTLVVDGTISADGGITASGGSIYVTADNMSGSGSYHTNGGGFYWAGQYIGMGGGGRVALYYATSSFTGGVFAKGGCNSFDGWSSTCAGSGTVVVKKVETLCQTNCYSNVLFLPGMMGSRLFEKSGDCGLLNDEKERWASTWDCDHAQLALNSDGKSVNPLYTKEGISGAIDDTYGFNIYESFIGDLKNWKERDNLINDYSLVAYDWRLSLEDILQNGATSTGRLSYSVPQGFTNSYIYQQLKMLADSSKTKKVTIVAHSNGGLVTKALIQKLKDTHDPLYDRIDNVVFVAVPQAGTPGTVGSILHGAGVGLKGIVMSAERVRDLLHNMPAGYNLLPSRSYIASTTPPLIEFAGNAVSPAILARYGDVIDTYDKLVDYLSGGDERAVPAYADLKHAVTVNPALLSNAETVHTVLDQWTPATTTMVYEIAGWGVYTPVGLRYENNKECIPAELSSTPQMIGTPQPIVCVGYTDTIKIQDKVTLNGDDTVVARSAHSMPTSSMAQKWWIDLGKYNSNNFINREHRDILEVPQLRSFIHSVIVNNFTPEQYITNDSSSLVSTKQYIKYQLHSPLNINIYDQAGNHTGIATSTGLIEEGINGSSYYTLGDTKIVIVPADILHTVKLDAYASGSFTFDLEELQGDTVVTSTTFEALPTATTTHATLLWTGTLLPTTTLAVDFNGDNIIDTTLKTTLGGTTVYDITPPEARFAFDSDTNRFVITGIDNLSSTTVKITATSTTIIDEAGNTTIVPFIEYKEEPMEIKVVFDTIIYNGIATTTPKTTLAYEWKFKNDILKSLTQEIHVEDDREVEARYKQSTNETMIADEIEKGEGKKIKLSKSGIAVVTVATSRGQLLIEY